MDTVSHAQVQEYFRSQLSALRVFADRAMSEKNTSHLTPDDARFLLGHSDITRPWGDGFEEMDRMRTAVVEKLRLISSGTR